MRAVFDYCTPCDRCAEPVESNMDYRFNHALVLELNNEDNEDYERYSESFSEYIYEIDDIVNIIKKCGFTLLGTTDDYSENQVSDTTERITFICKKTETIFKDELK